MKSYSPCSPPKPSLSQRWGHFSFQFPRPTPKPCDDEDDEEDREYEAAGGNEEDEDMNRRMMRILRVLTLLGMPRFAQVCPGLHAKEVSKCRNKLVISAAQQAYASLVYIYILWLLLNGSLARIPTY